MKPPNVEAAVISVDKITGYLLSPTHRDARHKAAVFLGLGFAADAWKALAAALLKHAADHKVARVESMPFGTRYVVYNGNATWTNAEHSFGVVSGDWSGRNHVLSRSIHSQEQGE